MSAFNNPAQNAMRPRPQSEFEERVVQIDRVARVVKGGRRFRFRATVVIGDRKNRVGLGVGKAGEVQGAIQKAVSDAKKNMLTVAAVNGTIPFSITSRFAGAKLLMKPARPGTGIIAGGAVRPIVELSGITNILSKSLGSDNRINNAKAAMRGLREIAGTDLTGLHVAETATAKKRPDASQLENSEEIAKAETKAEKDTVDAKQAKEEPKPKSTKTAKKKS